MFVFSLFIQLIAYHYCISLFEQSTFYGMHLLFKFSFLYVNSAMVSRRQWRNPTLTNSSRIIQWKESMRCMLLFSGLCAIIVACTILWHEWQNRSTEAALDILFKMPATRDLLNRRHYILAANFFNNEVIIGIMSREYVGLIRKLGVENVFVSIVENGIVIFRPYFCC